VIETLFEILEKVMPALRQLVQDLKRQLEQISDEVSEDELLADKTGLSADARDKARSLVVSFETFLQDHKTSSSATGPAICMVASRRGRRRSTPRAAGARSRSRRSPRATSAALDLFWLRDESLEDSASLPDPHILAQEIADDLRSALGQIEDILGDLEERALPPVERSRATGGSSGSKGLGAAAASRRGRSCP